MGEKDIAEKHLEDYNDVFADIVNVLLFKGKKLVESELLTTESPHSVYKADGKLHEQERDVAKIWKNGNIRIAILGLENQSAVDADMPMRIIGYDGAAYRSQLLKNEDNDRFAVVTIVLYFGYKHRWNQPKTLLGMLKKQNNKIPKELLPFVNDYKVHVFEIAWLSDEQIDMFQSDFRLVAKHFSQIRKNKNYVPSKQDFQHVDAVIKLLSVLTGDHRYENAYNTEGRRPRNMCELLDAVEKKGIEKGIEEGIEKGVKKAHFGTARKLLTRYAKNGVPLDSNTVSAIAEDCELSTEEVRSLATDNGIALAF